MTKCEQISCGKCQNDATKIQTSVSFLRLESKLEGLIKNKIDEKMIEIKNFDETLKKYNETLSIISKSYSQSVYKVTYQQELKLNSGKVIQETKNEELIQEKQRDARSKNIIIHDSRHQ